MQRLTSAKSIKWLCVWQMNGFAQLTHYNWPLTAVNGSILLRANICNLPYDTEQMSLSEWHHNRIHKQHTWFIYRRMLQKLILTNHWNKTSIEPFHKREKKTLSFDNKMTY